jgi:hypothetical protein
MNFDHLDITDEDGNYHVPDPQVCRVASQLYDLWPRMAAVYVSRPPRVARKDEISFYRAAKLCMTLGLQPEVYLHQILQGMSQVGHYYPKLIESRTILERGYERPEAKRNRWLRHYRAQVTLFEDRAPIYGYEALLNDPTAPFTPLFRCVMARLSGVGDSVVPAYKEAARLEFAAVEVASEIFGAESLEFLA